MKFEKNSTGGGMVEIIGIDRMKVSMLGDYYETLIYTKESKVLEYLTDLHFADKIISFQERDTHVIELKSQKFLEKSVKDYLYSNFGKLRIKEIRPVLPVLSHREMNVPYSTSEEMLKFNENKNWDLWKLAVHYETLRGNISSEEVVNKMKHIIGIIKASIREGINGTDFTDRILGYQSGKFR